MFEDIMIRYDESAIQGFCLKQYFVYKENWMYFQASFFCITSTKDYGNNWCNLGNGTSLLLHVLFFWSSAVASHIGQVCTWARLHWCQVNDSSSVGFVWLWTSLAEGHLFTSWQCAALSWWEAGKATSLQIALIHISWKLVAWSVQ